MEYVADREKKMNSLERVAAAFRHQEPDRVPVSEMGASMKVIEDFGCKDWYEFQQKMEHDMFVVRIKYKKSNADELYYHDEWGVEYRRTGEETDHSFKHPIEGPEDIDKLILPDPDDPFRFYFLEDAVREYKGKKSICFSSRAFFLWAVELVGMDRLLMLSAEEPEFCEELFDKILDNQIAVYKNAIRIGADVVIETDDYAYDKGPFMSPAMFEEMIEPRIKKWADAMHAAGAFCIKHSDGKMGLLLDSVARTGVDGFQSVDPSAGMVIKDVKEKYGDRLLLMGNIDCAHLLSFESPEKVYEVTKQTIAEAAPGGGFILSSSNTLTTTTAKENYAAMLQACRDWGKYPIHV